VSDRRVTDGQIQTDRQMDTLVSQRPAPA